MFKSFPAELLEALASEAITEHSHVYSITMEVSYLRKLRLACVAE